MTEAETIDLILKESANLQDVLNKDLLTKFAELHNIKKDKSKFHMKQEIVAKRGLFLDTKKQYALWIVNSEGVPCKEFVEKGLVTRRSDYPRYTKEKMRTILDLLLKQETISFKKILQYIKEIEHEIKGLIIKGDKSIAASKSFTKELTGPKGYKKVPYHVLGMLAWNRLEYEYFKTGTKGYLFRISGVDPYLAPKRVRDQIGKEDFRWITIPYEEEALPNYYQIDVAHMVNLAWTDRVNELLKPIIHKVNKNKKIEKKSIALF